MRMTDRPSNEEGALAPWFAAGREAAPLPSGEFMARMEALALESQPAQRAAPAAPARQSRGPGRLLARLRAMGGWPALAGLTAACAMGLWIGVAAPEAAVDWVATATQEQGLSGLDPASGFDYAMLGL